MCKVRGATNGNCEEQRGWGGKKDMCKAKGCYQRELRKVRGVKRICAKLGVLPTGIEKSKGGGGGGDRVYVQKLGVLPTGIVKRKVRGVKRMFF